jgi:hypothetical protein
MASDKNIRSSQSPQAKRGSAQDYTQFEGRGEVPASWYPEPTLEQGDLDERADAANKIYDGYGGGGLYDVPTHDV